MDEVDNEIREPNWSTMSHGDLCSWIDSEMEAVAIAEAWDPDWTEHYATSDAWDVLSYIPTEDLRALVMEEYS